MTGDFAELAKKLKEERPTILISHGQFVNSDDVYGIPKYSQGPVVGE